MEKTIVQFTSDLEMLGFLKANGTACRFVSVTLKTPVVKLKVKNPFHTIKNGKVVGNVGLWKISRKIGLINANYNMSVRRRIAEKLGVKLGEIEYTNGKVWYEHLFTKDTPPRALPIVQHKNPAKRQETGYGFQYFPHKSFKDVYVNASGDVVDNDVVNPWMYAETEPPDFKPAVIAPKLRHITMLKCSGVIIEMPDFEEAEAILAQ